MQKKNITEIEKLKALLREKEKEIEILESRKTKEIGVLSQISRTIVSGKYLDEILNLIVLRQPPYQVQCRRFRRIKTELGMIVIQCR